jgi:F-type H+-transporting ATPase subunit b
VLIDWFTVAAQILNFLILVVLLKWLLYDRIIRAMDRREADIASRFDEAERKRQEARDTEAAYRSKQKELEDHWDELLQDMKQQAETERKQWTEGAREEVDGLRERWLQALRDEKQDFAREFAEQSARRVFDISKRSLNDLAGAELEERVVEVFLSRLEDLPEANRRQIAEGLERESAEAAVLTAFEMPASLRRKTTRALHEALGTKADVRYETDPDMVMGIELKTGGRRTAWTAAAYVDALADFAGDFLEQRLNKTTEDGNPSNREASSGEGGN